MIATLASQHQQWGLGSGIGWVAAEEVPAAAQPQLIAIYKWIAKRNDVLGRRAGEASGGLGNGVG